MAEIPKDGNGVRRAFSDLAEAAVKLASVCIGRGEFGTTRSRIGEDTSARRMLRASVVMTDVSSLILLGAEVGPTCCTKKKREMRSVDSPTRVNSTTRVECCP
jgi:hypothetical protein